MVKVFSTSVVVRFCQAAFGFLITFFLSKLLGPSLFGQYAYVMSLVTVSLIPFQSGLANVLSRQLSGYVATNSWALWWGILSRARLFAICFLGALGLLSSILSIDLLIDRDIKNLEILVAGFLLFCVLGCIKLNEGILRGLGLSLGSQIPDFIVRHSVFSIFLSCMFFFDARVGVAHMLASHFFAGISALAVSIVMVTKAIGVKVTQIKPNFRTKEWLLMSLSFSIIGGAQILNGQLDILLLGVLKDDSTVGVYRVAMQVAMIVSLGLSAVNFILGPDAAKAYAVSDVNTLQSMVNKAVLFMSAFACLAAVPIMVFPNFILISLFGDDYGLASSALTILTLGHFFNCVLGPGGIILSMTGFEKIVTRVLLLTTVVNLILNLILIPPFGLIGAAASTVAVGLIRNSIFVLLMRKLLGIRLFKSSHDS